MNLKLFLMYVHNFNNLDIEEIICIYKKRGRKYIINFVGQVLPVDLPQNSD